MAHNSIDGASWLLSLFVLYFALHGSSPAILSTINASETDYIQQSNFSSTMKLIIDQLEAIKNETKNPLLYQPVGVDKELVEDGFFPSGENLFEQSNETEDFYTSSGDAEELMDHKSKPLNFTRSENNDSSSTGTKLFGNSSELLDVVKFSNRSNGYFIKLTFANSITWNSSILNDIVGKLHAYFEDSTYDNILLASVYSGRNASITWFNKSIILPECSDASELDDLTKKLFAIDRSTSVHLQLAKINVTKIEIVIEKKCSHSSYSRLDMLLAVAISVLVCIVSILFLIQLKVYLSRRSTSSMGKNFTRPLGPVILSGEALSSVSKDKDDCPRQPSILHSDYVYSNKAFETIDSEKPKFESFRYTDTL